VLLKCGIALALRRLRIAWPHLLTAGLSYVAIFCICIVAFAATSTRRVCIRTVARTPLPLCMLHSLFTTTSFPGATCSSRFARDVVFTRCIVTAARIKSGGGSHLRPRLPTRSVVAAGEMFIIAYA
jgi:hypothetical protein